MNAWETLVASALVGTNRQEPSIDLTHPALADYTAALPSQSPTQQILSAAGLIAAYQAVGNSPALATSPLLAPTPEADLPCCTQLTARHLSAILNESRYEPILPELLQLLAQAGQTVPPDYLPLLLERGKRDKNLRPFILPILGTRGQWLARRNPKWNYVLDTKKFENANPDKLREIWMTGTRNERLTALTIWRHIQPAESREAVAANWKQDKADDRQAWLEVLQIGLSLDDEKFLDVALFDRNESVRLAAVHLLNQLPSKYRQRLTELANQCLKISEKGNSYKIDVNYPEAGNREWQDAGVNDKVSRVNNRNGGNISDAEWRFLQVVSATDLSFWPDNIELLVKAATHLNQNFVLLTSWAKAACYQKRSDWIEVLLTRSSSTLGSDSIRQLLKSLSKDALNLATKFFIRILSGDNFSNNFHQNLEIMMNYDREWNPEISILVVRQFHNYIHKRSLSSSIYYREENISHLLGQYLDISVLPELQQMQAELSIEQFSYSPCIELLEFRRDMRSVFNTA